MTTASESDVDEEPQTMKNWLRDSEGRCRQARHTARTVDGGQLVDTTDEEVAEDDDDTEQQQFGPRPSSG